MRRRLAESDEFTPAVDEFTKKVNELDFDPWRGEDEDGSPRRRDPLRRPTGRRPDDDEDAD